MQLPDNDSVKSLLGSLKQLPPHISIPLCEQTTEFLHQAEFLRRALHIQSQLTGKDALNTTEQQHELDKRPEDTLSVEAVNQLGTLFSAASTFTPQVIDVVAQAVKCHPETVRSWFEQRNRSTRQACKRLSKKWAGEGLRRGALFRRTQAAGASASSGPSELRLAPKTALESSMTLMRLLDRSDASRPRIKDQSAAKAFACVTQCPSVLLQTLLLRCIEHTRQMHLMSLSKSEVYTTLAQWLQDAVLAGNEELMRLCLAAYSSIPFTEVHVVTMTTHQMYNEGSSAQPSRKKHRDEANPTIAEYVERLRGPQYSTSVQRAAVHLLDKWAREMDNADKVEVITAGAAAQQTQQTGKQKKNNSKHVESTKPITFPKDRRMKMTEDVALPMNASDALEFKISNAQKSSAAAQKRRKAADSGPLSVADIKKRKQAEQLRREMANKKQRSTAGVAVSKAATAINAATAGPSQPASVTPTGAVPTTQWAAPMPSNVVPGAASGRNAAAESAAAAAAAAASTHTMHAPHARVAEASGPGSAAAPSHSARTHNENTHAQAASGAAPRDQRNAALDRSGNSASAATATAAAAPVRPPVATGDSKLAEHVATGERPHASHAYAHTDAAHATGSQKDSFGAASTGVNAVNPDPAAAARAAYGEQGVGTGIEQLHAFAKTGKAKKRRKLTCFEAEELLVEDAHAMLQKANANPGQCHPDVLKELQSVMKRGDRVKSVRAKRKDQPTKEAMDALVPTTSWRLPAPHSLSENLIQLRSTWAAESNEVQEQKERTYLSARAPQSATVSQVTEAPGINALNIKEDKDTEDPDSPSMTSFPFWQDIPEDTKPHSAWWQFKGRVHLVALAQAWEQGIRLMPASTGIPLVGISEPQLKAARKVFLEANQAARQEQEQAQPLPLPPPPDSSNVLPGPPTANQTPPVPAQGIYAAQQQVPVQGGLQGGLQAQPQYMQQQAQQQAYQPMVGQSPQPYVMQSQPQPYVNTAPQMVQQPGIVVSHQQAPMVHVHAHLHAQPAYHQPQPQQPAAYALQQHQAVYHQQQQPVYQQAYQQQQAVHGFQQQPQAFQQQQPQVHGFQQPAMQQQQPGFQQQPAGQYQQPSNVYVQQAPQVAAQYQQPNNWQ